MASEYRPDRRIRPTEPLNRVGIASEEYDEARRKQFEKAAERVLPNEKRKKFTLDVPKKEPPKK
jgi:hypothetical protein